MIQVHVKIPFNILTAGSRYEKLQRWDDALKAYTAKASQAVTPHLALDATLGLRFDSHLRTNWMLLCFTFYEVQIYAMFLFLATIWRWVEKMTLSVTSYNYHLQFGCCSSFIRWELYLLHTFFLCIHWIKHLFDWCCKNLCLYGKPRYSFCSCLNAWRSLQLSLWLRITFPCLIL